MLLRPCVQNVPGKIGEVSPSGYNIQLHPRESGPEAIQGPGDVITSPTFMGGGTFYKVGGHKCALKNIYRTFL